MSSVEVFTPAPMQFSDSAVAKVRSLIEEEGNDRLSLRVFVTGGGCSGFQYGFTFDDELAEDDTVIERDGVRLGGGPLSVPYLAGAEADFQAGRGRSRLVINTPTASTTCGCVSSFSTRPGPGVASRRVDGPWHPLPPCSGDCRQG